MFRGNSWRLGRFGGIEIKIHPSWSIIALLIAYSFYWILAADFAAQNIAVLIFVAVVMSAVFFISVLLHELAHSWTARSRGIEVKGITLFLFGGATEADLDSNNPIDELVISSIGPITSAALAAVFWAIAVGAGPGLTGFAAGQLGWINLALAVFNVIPGYPLDGGRILRSLVWRSTGDLDRATRVAAQAGVGIGYTLVGLGILEILLLGALIGGLWLAAIGWFLAQLAQATFAQMKAKRMLREVPASRVMLRHVVEIPAWTPIQQAVDDYFMRNDFDAYPVVDGDRVIGLVTLGAVRTVPRQDWPGRPVRDVVTPLSEASVVDPSKPMDEVLETLTSNEVKRVIVVDQGEIVGIIASRDVTRWLQRSEDLGLARALNLHS
jgi:Zn-dependent protease/CBS domain-containing protein